MLGVGKDLGPLGHAVFKVPVQFTQGRVGLLVAAQFHFQGGSRFGKEIQAFDLFVLGQQGHGLTVEQEQFHNAGSKTQRFMAQLIGGLARVLPGFAEKGFQRFPVFAAIFRVHGSFR